MLDCDRGSAFGPGGIKTGVLGYIAELNQKESKQVVPLIGYEGYKKFEARTKHFLNMSKGAWQVEWGTGTGKG